MFQRLIPLTQGKYAVIDDADYEWVSRHKWHYTTNGYAARNCLVDGRRTVVLMHRLLLSAPKGIDVDHIDGNKLNNSSLNLRLASRAENLRNKKASPGGSSKYKGVNWIEPNKKWRVHIQIEGKQMPLGCYLSEVEAARAYNAAATRLFGNFAWLNIIEE